MVISGTKLVPGEASRSNDHDLALAQGRHASRRGPSLLAALACTLALPSLAIGLSTDDHVHLALVQEGSPISGLFMITPDRFARGLEIGQFAWWTNPQLSGHFFRPLSALLHYVEYRAYPGAPWLMHVVSVLAYAALVVLACRLYRVLLPTSPRTAAVAALLFAIDDGHAPTVGWIAGRNTMLAGLFALCALWFHIRARREPHGFWPALASVACVALALASAEFGVSVFAYLVAYAVALETGALRSRLLSLLPALGVGMVWAAVYVTNHYGMHGAGLYRDLSTPFATLAEGLLDLPSWLLSLFGPSLISTAIFAPPTATRLVCAALVLPLLAALYFTLPRSPETRFFALGAGLCLPPVFTTLPQDRLLLLAGFGAFGLLASFLDVARHSALRFVRAMRYVFIALHAVIAPLSFVAALNPTGPIEHGSRVLAEAVPRRAPAQIVAVQLPIELLTLYCWAWLRDDPNRVPPQSLHQLYGGGSPLVVRRTDARTLELDVADGWGRLTSERVFASLASLPRGDDERTRASIQIRVLESNSDGRPRRVQFRFPDELESADRLWLTWRGTRLERWTPPAIGAEVALPALNPFQALSAI